jgi:hypothetical protein
VILQFTSNVTTAKFNNFSVVQILVNKIGVSLSMARAAGHNSLPLFLSVFSQNPSYCFFPYFSITNAVNCLIILQVARDGLISFYELDQLSYFCESCPRHYYSLDAGWFEYSRPNHASTANRTGPGNPIEKGYYTLLVNYSSPSPELSGRTMHHKVMFDVQ